MAINDDAAPGTLLWLDDLRPAPRGWTHARSVNEAIAVMTAGTVRFASLDHDLGDFAIDGGDGYKLTDWMAEHDRWPVDGIQIHSANPVGVRTMLVTVDRYGPYAPGFDAHRGTLPSS